MAAEILGVHRTFFRVLSRTRSLTPTSQDPSNDSAKLIHLKRNGEGLAALSIASKGHQEVPGKKRVAEMSQRLTIATAA